MICDYRLKVFHTVAVKGSFTAAARELGITQPAVSNHISELEGSIGDTLFYRSRKETVLTPKGKILFEYAEKILNLYRCADRELMPSRRNERRQLVIAAVPEAARFILKPLVDNYTRIYPGTEISILERSREEAADPIIGRVDLDFAILEGSGQLTLDALHTHRLRLLLLHSHCQGILEFLFECMTTSAAAQAQ